MTEHDPGRFASSLGEKLASRSRNVITFLGAGVASACGLPTVSGLETEVLERLESGNRTLFERQLDERNLEEALSRLRRIASLLGEDQELDDLTRDEAEALDERVCQAIVKALDLDEADLGPMRKFAAWAGRVHHERALEVFTVNYDLLIETALEELGAPYFDGFVGNLAARFHPQLVERTESLESEQLPASFVRLWKIHGSVNWVWRGNDIVRLGRPVHGATAAAIYPSDTKYDESRRVPFVVLQDRFRRALHEQEALVLISGYSFSDDHLDEMIFKAARQRERSEFIVFCYSDIPEKLKERAEVTPNIQAVGPEEALIGGEVGTWSGADEPIADVWEDGEFLLGDFKHLSAWLSRSTTREDGRFEDLQGLEELLAGVWGSDDG